jgi:hypothetical protein
MVNRLLPIAPKDSSIFSDLGLIVVDREGDLGRVKRPLNADTDFCVAAGERVDNGDDRNEGSGASTF